MRRASSALSTGHRGHPVGGGFGASASMTDAPTTLDEMRGPSLIFLKKTIRPYGWRDRDARNSHVVGVRQTADAVSDPRLARRFSRRPDILSPWTARGRYYDLGGGPRSCGNVFWIPDREWCDQHQLDYMPVVFSRLQLEES